MENQIMKVKKLAEDAILPTQAHPGDAGWDIYSYYDAYIDPHTTEKLPTKIAVELPHGTFGAVYARSGLATNFGLRPANCVGVIDCGYRGECMVPLHNDSDEIRVIARGDRIAQLIVTPYVPVELIEADELDDSERGAGGFGSSGK